MGASLHSRCCSQCAGYIAQPLRTESERMWLRRRAQDEGSALNGVGSTQGSRFSHGLVHRCQRAHQAGPPAAGYEN